MKKREIANILNDLTKDRSNINNILFDASKFNFKIFGTECSLYIQRQTILLSSYIRGQTISFQNWKE